MGGASSSHTAQWEAEVVNGRGLGAGAGNVDYEYEEQLRKERELEQEKATQVVEIVRRQSMFKAQMQELHMKKMQQLAAASASPEGDEDGYIIPEEDNEDDEGSANKDGKTTQPQSEIKSQHTVVSKTFAPALTNVWREIQAKISVDAPLGSSFRNHIDETTKILHECFCAVTIDLGLQSAEFEILIENATTSAVPKSEQVPDHKQHAAANDVKRHKSNAAFFFDQLSTGSEPAAGNAAGASTTPTKAKDTEGSSTAENVAPNTSSPPAGHIESEDKENEDRSQSKAAGDTAMDASESRLTFDLKMKFFCSSAGLANDVLDEVYTTLGFRRKKGSSQVAGEHEWETEPHLPGAICGAFARAEKQRKSEAHVRVARVATASVTLLTPKNEQQDIQA